MSIKDKPHINVGTVGHIDHGKKIHLYSLAISLMACQDNTHFNDFVNNGTDAEPEPKKTQYCSADLLPDQPIVPVKQPNNAWRGERVGKGGKHKFPIRR